MLAACEYGPLPARHSFGVMVRRNASRLVVPFRARYFAADGEVDMISANFGGAKRSVREKQRGSFCDA